MKVAVIDLGTNTFNLLIAEHINTSTQLLYSKKIAVKLAQGIGKQKVIKNAALHRAKKAIQEHLKIVHDHKVDKILAYATAGIRNTANGKDFIQRMNTEFSLDILIIEGEKEAELIYHGVKQSVDIKNDKVLIMDIGGGSLEFIIANQDKIFWKMSYQIGVAFLLERFNPSDPITYEEIEFISDFLENKLVKMIEESRKHCIKTLIGASGSFESFSAMIRQDNNFESEISLTPNPYTIDLDNFDKLYFDLICSTLKERKNMVGLERMRVEYIVLAIILVKFVVDKLKIKKLIQSNYAIKEGIIYQYFH